MDEEGRQDQERHADQRDSGPTPVDREGDTEERRHSNQIATQSGQDPGPNLRERPHVALYPLDQRAWRVGQMMRGVEGEGVAQHVRPHGRGAFLADPGQQATLAE